MGKWKNESTKLKGTEVETNNYLEREEEAAIER